jgi:threonyl-tRNA synthetase
MSFEESDSGNEVQVSNELVQELKENCERLGVKTIVLYPYVHLLFGKKPSNPKTALQIMDLTKKELEEKGFKVIKSPFGWYKSFSLKCKGHPLSELSRTILGKKTIKEKEISQALKAEEKLKSEWFIMDKGKLFKIEIKNGKIVGYDFKENKKLEELALYELAKSREVKEEPPHIKLMKQLELSDYEPGSDPGNLRFPPKGRLVKSLLEELTTKTIIEHGAMEIESPIMYDFEHPALKNYLNRFPARQYTTQSPNKKLFLRFAACFGQFLMAHDAMISYKHLPIWLYELTKYSFRVEKRGELTGLRRLRAFTMPDCHALCADMEQAKKELIKRFELAKNLQKKIGFKIPEDMELAVRIVKPFFEKNKEFIINFVNSWGKPALIELWDEQFFYFVFKYEFNFVDALGKASALTTDQIDTENSKRYNLTFVNKENKRVNPIILHLSPTGAIERIIYALLEKAFMEEKNGKIPVLPFWLSPTQVRLLPVSKNFIELSEKFCSELEKEKIRVDIDDRDESISKKIRDAEIEWIPLIIVIGEKEKNLEKFNVRIREKGIQQTMNKKELLEFIKEEQAGMPFKKLPLPKLLSKRPVFIQ